MRQHCQAVLLMPLIPGGVDLCEVTQSGLCREALSREEGGTESFFGRPFKGPGNLQMI